ncbi:hypothetical protein FB45DRAFT_898917 [Roridomyces roridus]|uniref:DUF6534 domain-containing protein n=1 Tax=Roridomyces roridus TaxID=1738132 RepID=A0AAD7CCK2_9AGAR|nr:hypothetical protein FB45DRAFT_898917 [Roridomyces roridus]
MDPAAAAAAAAALRIDVKYFLGSWLVGSAIELTLLGVLCCQFVNYFHWYSDDRRLLRYTVAGLALLNIFKSILVFASLWIFFINHYGDIITTLQMSTTAWWDTANPLLVAILNFYVQCYFCTRLLAVSKRWWWVLPIFVTFVFALIAMVVATYYISIADNVPTTHWFAAHFGSVFSGDVLLTSFMAYHLIKTKKTAMSTHTTALISSLIRITFQTAAPAAVVAACNLVFSQLHATNRPELGFVEIAFNQILPKVYAISMMYTLNERRAIRMKMSGSRSQSQGTGSDGPTTYPRRTTRANKNDLELSRIEVVTQTETSRHVDVSGMFNHGTQHSLEDSKIRFDNADPKYGVEGQ